MKKIAKTNFNKTSKYIIGALFILSLSSIVFYDYIKKQDIYILYDDFKNCTNAKDYEKEIYYGMCYKQEVIFFEKETNKQICETKTLEKLNLTSKEDFFKIDFRKLKNVNIILIIKKDKGYDIMPVKPFKIIS